MPYERSREIEQRFEKVIDLIGKEKLNSRELASQLGVSIPTAQRIINELKRRGHSIRAVRDEAGWHYEITGQRFPNSKSRTRLVQQRLKK